MLGSWYTKHPLVFAHRGASAYAPMNTIPAFELAVTQGADGIELDVQCSRDGHLVVIHDYTVDHSTDGSGRVSGKTLAELKALDAGSWFGERFRGTRIPTLDEVFEATGRRLFINVEIKSKSADTDGVEQLVADAIARHAMQDLVLVSSFNPLALSQFRAAMAEVPIAFLHAPDLVMDTGPLLLELGLHYEARHPHHSQVDERSLATWHKSGYRVHAWTVNDPARAAELRDLGVDGLFTDYPDLMLQAVRAS